jgi:hypothetical protein
MTACCIILTVLFAQGSPAAEASVTIVDRVAERLEGVFARRQRF